MKKNAWFHLPALLFAVLIFVLSSIPDFSTPGLGFEMEDKVYHLIEYFIFGLLLSRSGHAFQDRLKYPFFILVFLAGTLYAASDEIHQFFVPGRECDILDFAFDSAGILLGQTVYWVVIRYLRNRLPSSNY